MKTFVLDEEINLLESQGENGKLSADLLNTMPYVNTLTECVMNAPEDKTFNIGLFGEWGSGKSSILRTFKEQISERYKAEGKKVKVITYDAWKYANDSFRRMFLLQMQQDLGFEREELMNRFYLNSSEDAHIDTKIDKHKLFWGVLIVIAVIIAVNNIGLTTDHKIVANALVSLGSLVLAVIYGAFKEVKVNIQRPHLFAPEQFEDCFNEMCEKAHHKEGTPLSFLKWIKGEVGEEGLDRLIIVIDNVDRCSSELAYELLTNIKNFLGCKHNTIFIVPVDEDALKRHFEPANTSQQDDSAEFLRKFFNICIRIKPFKRDEMYDFADAINKKHELGFEPTTVSLVANEFAHNPRRIIQMFNNLSVELQSLPKEYDEKHQALVCLLLIIREEYPKFYSTLQSEPMALFSSEKRGDTSDDVKDFLTLNSAVINTYGRNVIVIERILSNTPIEEKIPQTLKTSYENMTYSEETVSYITDIQHRKALMHYVENRLKQAIKRKLWATDVKNHVDRLLSLNDTIHLTKEENLRVAGMMSGSSVFDEIADKQPNLHKLIDYASQLEKQGINLLAVSLSNYIAKRGGEGEEYNDRVEVWYACSKLSSARVKTLGKVSLAACKKNMKSVISQDYGSENSKIVFSDEIINYLLSKMSSDEDEVEKIMNHIASKITLSSSNLSLFVKALDSVTPSYDYAHNNTPDLQKRMKALNQMLGKCQKVKLTGTYAQSIADFYKKFVASTAVSSSINYGRSTSITQRGYYLDNLGNTEIINDLLEFLKYSSLITGYILVEPNTVIKFLETKNHDEQAIEIFTVLHAAEYPVENYKEPILKIETFSDKHLSLLDYILKHKGADGSYSVGDDKTKEVIEKLLTFILDETHGDVSHQIAAIQHLVEDPRNADVIKSILSSKDKEWLLSLPNELIGYAISVFENNIDDYKDQQNVMLLLASKGNSKVRKAVVRIANAKINDEQQRAAGIEIIKSFPSLSASDTKPLVTSLEFIKEGKPETASVVDECLKHLEEIKSVKVVNKDK